MQSEHSKIRVDARSLVLLICKDAKNLIAIGKSENGSQGNILKKFLLKTYSSYFKTLIKCYFVAANSTLYK